MPTVSFVHNSITFHHEVPTGVSVYVVSETQTFDITFTISGYPACYFVVKGVKPLQTVTFQAVNAAALYQQVLHIFSITAGGPAGTTPTSLTAVVTNANGEQSSPALCAATIENP